MCSLHCLYLFFFNVTATTEIYTLSLHDALPISTEADMAADFPDYEVGAIPPIGPDTPAEVFDMRLLAYQQDRKSTRLNSSHTVISYAVFCLKKKKNITNIRVRQLTMNNNNQLYT